MRQGELAKIRIKKKKYGFGRKLNQDKLRFPTGISEEFRARLLKKGVIYELKLLEWVDRIDLDGDDGDGKYLKTVVSQSEKREWEKPLDIDDIKFSVRAWLSDKDPALNEGVKTLEIF
jgi:hypothetical protein